MKTIAAVTVTAFVLLVPNSLSAQQPSPLGGAYSVRIGDVASSTLSEFLKLRPDLRDPTIVTYEPTPGVIDVEVFGRPSQGSKTDQARTLLGKYWEFIQAAHVPYVERRFTVKLSAEHYRLLYYDAGAQGGPQLVLQFVNGQYLIP